MSITIPWRHWRLFFAALFYGPGCTVLAIGVNVHVRGRVEDIPALTDYALGLVAVGTFCVVLGALLGALGHGEFRDAARSGW